MIDQMAKRDRNQWVSPFEQRSVEKEFRDSGIKLMSKSPIVALAQVDRATGVVHDCLEDVAAELEHAIESIDGE